MFVYILESTKNQQFYIGHTQDPEKRLAEHNSGKTKSTRNRGPWQILHKKKVKSKVEAIRLERQLKAWKNKERIIAWIEREVKSGS